jgi:hypothetical protein
MNYAKTIFGILSLVAIGAAGIAPTAHANPETPYGWSQYEMICDNNCNFRVVCESFYGYECDQNSAKKAGSEVVSLGRQPQLEQRCAVSYKRVWDANFSGVLFYVYSCPSPGRQS